MKNIKLVIITILLFTTFSCDEEQWLKEEPMDFYSPENLFTSPENFNAAVGALYQKVGKILYENNRSAMWALYWPSDQLYQSIGMTHLNPYKDAVIPENTQYIESLWDDFYSAIFDANVILGRIDDESIPFTNENDRNILKAEALFLRSFEYRILGILWGGVPLVTEEIKEPKRDFVRASREAVFAQCINDLKFAVDNLPEVTDVKEDGRLTKAAANHLLAELYIITEDWDNAISAASAVIDNPNYALMTERFGTRQDEPGDVYWDLFRENNQNRHGGGGLNTEAIWVRQYEYETPGGGTSLLGPRYCTPMIWSLKGKDDNVNLFIGPTVQNGGRGIGWLVANDYLLDQVWADDANDIRNSEYNVIRDIVADNPESKWYGQKIVENEAFNPEDNLQDAGYRRFWSAIWRKMTAIDYPSEAIVNPETGLVNSKADQIYTDNYIFRLAETYLLRAEAYLGKGELGLAVNDINDVRDRANCLPITADKVDIDFILDERSRELHFEEPRVLTLMRTNKFVERVRLYNVKSKDFMADHNNVWPIPASAIERNTEAVLEQNPGY